MDKTTAARLLGVAAYTITDLQHDGDGWAATVRDMATHQTAQRRLPGAAPAAAVEAEAEVQAPAATAKPARAPKAAKKAQPAAGRKAAD